MPSLRLIVLLSVLGLVGPVSFGFATARRTDTARSGIEQLLIPERRGSGPRQVRLRHAPAPARSSSTTSTSTAWTKAIAASIRGTDTLPRGEHCPQDRRGGSGVGDS